MVYFHIDPKTKDIVYVGYGKRDRPWMMSNSGGEAARYGKRSKPHFEWYIKLEQQGVLLQDIVTIYARNLKKEDALSLEKECIKKYNPIFNKPVGGWNRKVTQEVYDKAANLHKAGKPLSQISDNLGLSVMAIQRALVGKNVSINSWYSYKPNEHFYRLKETA